MDNIFFNAALVSVLFFIAKCIESRVDTLNERPIKYLVRDSIIVYFSVISIHFITSQLYSITSYGGSHTPVFTDNPEF